MALILRKIIEDDLNMIMNWRMMPEVTKYMYTDPKLTLEDQKKWYESIMCSDKAFYWIIQFDGIDIGLINIVHIDKINKRCEWAYYIADTSFRGKGIATLLECNIYDFVFHELHLNKVCCEVFCNNEKVIAIHKKFGAEIEGIQRQHIRKNGEYLDIVQMAITKEKWHNIRDSYHYENIEIENYLPIQQTDSSLCLGQSCSFTKTITEADVALFAGVTGDFNSIHINEIEAAKSIFGKRVCHGMLVASYISTVLGTALPGEGTIYRSQKLDFVKPAFIGDTITATVTVKQCMKKNIILLETIVTNQNHETLIEGEAVVKAGN